MCPVPPITVKDGVTLSLSGVDWQVTGTDLVGDALERASYQAVATYSGKSYYKAAIGYVTTADYTGEISRDGVESVTYKGLIEVPAKHIGNTLPGWVPYVIGGLGLLAAAPLRC